MPQMIRKQIYIESKHDEILKRLARELGITEAEAIRRAIDRQRFPVGSGIRDRAAWEREKTFIAQRMAAGPVQSRRRWRREEAYADRIDRYGR
jgi:hypothetical protein